MPIDLKGLEVHRDALLSVTSFGGILKELGIARAEDGLPPNWLEVLPSFPGTPKPSLRVDRSRCMQDVFHMVYTEQVGAAALLCDDDSDPDLAVDSKKSTPRPGAVCIVASSGSGKTFLLQRMAADGVNPLSTVGAGAADPTFLDWLRRVVIVAVNFNAQYQITHREAALVKDGVFSFEDLVRLRLIYCELANLDTDDKMAFRDFITCTDFAVREGVLSERLREQETEQLLLERAGRGAGTNPIILFVDEVAKIGETKDVPVQTLREYVSANAKRFEDADGFVPSIVALLVSACCHVADGGGASVLSSSTESRLVQDGATVLSGRRAPHYNGLVDNPEDCVPLCLAALTRLARRGLYLYSREIDSTVLARVLHEDVADHHDGGQFLSPRSVELLTPIARSLAFAVGGHLRTAVQLFLAVRAANDQQDVGAMLNAIVTDGFNKAASELWDASSEEDRNQFMATLILGKEVDYTDTAFSSSCADLLPGGAPPKWDYVRRRGLVYGSGSPFRPRLSPIMLRRLLKRESSKNLLFQPSLSSLVDTSAAPSWMQWESFCCGREWAHSIARSLERDEFKAVRLGELLGKGSTHCGEGDLLSRTLVNASVPRSGVSCHNLQTLLSWEGTPQEANLTSRVWLLTEKTPGIDAIMFFKCVQCVTNPELEGKLVAVGMQYKFTNLVTEDKKQKVNLLSLKVVNDGWSNLAADKAFGPYWAKWMDRLVYWCISFLEAQTSFDMMELKRTSPACVDAAIVTVKSDLIHAFDATTFHNSMAPGVLMKCVVQPF